MIVSILLFTFYLFLFVLLIYKSNFFNLFEGKFRHLTTLIFLIKVFAGLGILFYLNHSYQDKSKLDIFNFYNDGLIVYKAFKTNLSDFLNIVAGFKNNDPYFLEKYYGAMDYWYRPQQDYLINSNHSIIIFNGIMNIFSLGSIYINTLFISFLSFVGLICTLKFFQKNKPISFPYFLIIMLLPSSLIWSNTLLKEGLAFFAIGLCLWFSKKLLLQFSLKKLIGLLLFLSFLMFIKFYLFISLVIALDLFISAELLRKKIQPKSIFIMGVLIYLIIFQIFGLFFPNYSIIEIIKSKQYAFEKFLAQHPANFIVSVPIINSIYDLVLSTPLIFKNVLIEPISLNNIKIKTIPIIIDNLMFLGLLTHAIFKLKNKKIKIDTSYLGIALCFGLFVFYIIGVTTPVLHAIFRYRSVVFPLILAALYAPISSTNKH